MTDFPAGVLVDFQLRQLIAEGLLRVDERCIQPASLDLPVGRRLWEVAGLPALKEGDGFSFKEFTTSFSRNTYSLGAQPATLSPGSVYLAELDGSYTLPAVMYGYANPKSSTGRIDVHCTLIAEGAESFNTVPHGYMGKLYVLIVPQSFPIILSVGDTLVQLRLFKGQRQFLNSADLTIEQEKHKLVEGRANHFTDQGAVLRLNLETSPTNLVAQVIGKPINLTLRDADPRSYFVEKPIMDDVLFLEPGQFLLSSTLEVVRVPPHLCAEMLPFREEYGELRTHYAGFIDPGFGYGEAGEVSPSYIVYEIRNIGAAPIMLAHGQPIGLLRYENLSTRPATLYGAESIATKSNYQGQQGIKLAKYFSPWKD